MKLKVLDFDKRPVSRMKDNETAGYGPSYVSDREGPAWVFWVEDCFDPPMYFLRCADIVEAFDHAEIVLCPEVGPGDLTPQELEEIINSGSALGYSQCEDGSIRYTETLQVAEYRYKPNRKVVHVQSIPAPPWVKL